jgi:hypothetical protein
VLIGFTLIPGLCHLAGTSKAKTKNMGFDETQQMKRDLENEKLRLEIEMLEKQKRNEKDE